MVYDIVYDVYVCMCIYIYIYTHTYIHNLFIHIHTHIVLRGSLSRLRLLLECLVREILRSRLAYMYI